LGKPSHGPQNLLEKQRFKMEQELTAGDKQRIEAGIRGKYLQVAISPEGLFRYPTGRAGLEALGYDPGIVGALPDTVAEAYCGVGNPFSLGPIAAGEAVLDIGCGAGVDSIIAGKLTGPAGAVTGIDLVPEMLAKARENARLAGADNVTFQESSAERLPFPAKSFEAVISNGVFNLVVDKAKALAEVYRVLKPGGRFWLADQVLAGELPQETKSRVENWARWEGGAIPGKVFLALLEQAGFEGAELVAETGFNSSPATKGMLFRAVKPVAAAVRERLKPAASAAVGTTGAPSTPDSAPGGTWPSRATRAPGEPEKIAGSKPVVPPPNPSPGATWPSGELQAQVEPAAGEPFKLKVRPMLEACGIDVFKTARHNGFDIDTRKETYGRWNYFALVLIE
jgi:arsenite methyltransferase